MDKLVTLNPWQSLRRFTAARIALGRSGVSQPTDQQQAFQLAHAQARDAVHLALDHEALQTALNAAAGLPCVSVHSAARDRHVYLQRPDLGRRLDEASRAKLAALPKEAGYDLAVVIADGLSALAIEQHAAPFLRSLMAHLDGWRIAPITIVEQGRVAIGDDIGDLLHAQIVVVLIGERPGLSSPDSMGLYLTFAPRPGLTDACRNCISNVRTAGLTYEAAAFKLHYLLSESRRRRLSGVALKDETANEGAIPEAPQRNFLLE
ncbi:Ethanolamine ammonia-lyase light chain [Duganella sp. CF402]|uniref:ethanolamine ammonia-lyase subunit EutC n=1 Tax=unclassified Duganella TaxID=2636909 RepID=UPI0008CCC25A|nr:MULTISPECIES: ethanolamine ammonia-lyase subunit EutC [unclassified Duganella]RZT08016.1 ethanolamine ammonia-lyase light chain [Duganella sp. BK701]SEM08493.1 Ethanolamine ammonia-lyase light chain [Duganella sp. CF402]